MLKQIRLNILLIFAVFIGLTATQCTQEGDRDSIKPLYRDATEFDNSVALAWNEVFLELDRYSPAYRSPIAARAAAYINLAAYESIVPGMSDAYTSIAASKMGISVPKVKAGESYFWPLVMNACYKYSIINFFPSAAPNQQLLIQDKFDQFLRAYSNEVDAATITRSINYGRLVAHNIFSWAQSDAFGHEAYLNLVDPTYVPPVGPGLWKPTAPDFSPAVLPNWGKARTFVLGHAELDIPAPMVFTTQANSPLYEQYSALMTITDMVKVTPTANDRWIAEFWSDDNANLTFSPASRWLAIATQVVGLKNINLAEAAVVFTKVSLALNDAAVITWHNKYKYNTMRPVQYIHENMGRPDWTTALKTFPGGDTYSPPYPAYPSEHASYAYAVSEVLDREFGTAIHFTDRCHELRTEFWGTPRTFSTFAQMAQECAYSRMPLGVNITQDGSGGIEAGNKVAVRINKLAFRK